MSTWIIALIFIGVAAYLFGPPKKARVFAVKRIALLPVYFVFSFFAVALFVSAAPGDPVDAIVGPAASEEVRERVREDLGLNKPFFNRYGNTLVNEWVQGDFGETYRFPGKPVTEAVFERIPVTGLINLIAAFFAIIIATVVGLTATLKRGTLLDTPLLMAFLIPAVIPSLILIQFIILFFTVKLGWLPGGWSGDWTAVFSINSVIPITVLTLGSMAGIARFIRTVTLKIMDEQYVLTAKAKGLSNFRIMTRYVMRNASLPLSTVILPLFLTAFTGSFFIEKIYGIPGLAVFTLESLFRRDLPVILFLGVWGYMFTLFTRLFVDVTMFKLDRRVSQ